MMKITKIGLIILTFLDNINKQDYSDSSESFLYNFFNLPESQKQNEIIKILNSNPSWPIRYNISPRRLALLSWYDFKHNTSLLEVGAGCGALTGLFCRKVKQVYANELTPARGKIIAKRFSDLKNLKIYIGNIISMPEDNKFDYITAIGSLEYAGKYVNNNLDDYNKPYINFLNKLKSLLKENGHLLLAIENKIGLKYLAGGKENHYGNFFSSIENYPNYKGVRTFSKNELGQLLKKVGFKKTIFYYPFPDYILPSYVFSDEGLANNNLSRSSFSKIVDFSDRRLELYDEVVMAFELVKENIFHHFANSFLIDASL